MKEIQGEIGMKTGLFHTCKSYKVQYLPKDILSGIIMAAVSIPIAMGYFRQFTDFTVRYFRFCYLRFFLRRHSLSWESMQHRRRS